MTRWVAIPVSDRAGMRVARRAVGQANVDRLNALDAMVWRMAADGGTPGEISVNVETLALARGLTVPERDDATYVTWKACELSLWNAYLAQELAAVVDGGDIGDTDALARVVVNGFEEINGPLIANADRTRTARTDAVGRRSRPPMSNSERGFVRRENDRRAGLGLDRMSVQERDYYVDELRANDTDRPETIGNDRPTGNAIPTYQDNQPREAAAAGAPPSEEPTGNDRPTTPSFAGDNPDAGITPGSSMTPTAKAADIRTRCRRELSVYALQADQIAANYQAKFPKRKLDQVVTEVYEPLARLMRTHRDVFSDAIAKALRKDPPAWSAALPVTIAEDLAQSRTNVVSGVFDASDSYVDHGEVEAS